MARPRWGVLFGSALALSLSGSCVPASEPAEPAGAIGFRTEPTAASRGEPFTTDDGWTVRVERLAIQLRVNGASTTANGDANGDFGGGSYGEGGEYRIGSEERVEMFVRAVRVGTARLGVSLQGTYFYEGRGTSESAEIFGLSKDALSRFGRAADVVQAAWQPPYRYGPSLLLKARASKGDRREFFDLSILAFSFDLDPSVAPAAVVGEVRADSLTLLPLTVAAEALFRDIPSGRLSFDDFAYADRDEDGELTAKELNATSTVYLGSADVNGDGILSGEELTAATEPRAKEGRKTSLGLLDVLVGRAGRILSPR